MTSLARDEESATDVIALPAHSKTQTEAATATTTAPNPRSRCGARQSESWPHHSSIIFFSAVNPQIIQQSSFDFFVFIQFIDSTQIHRTMDSSSAESSGELSQDEFQDEVIPSPPRTPTTEEIIEKQTELIVKTPNDPIPYLRRATAYHQRRPPNLRRAYSDACHAVRLATLGSHRDGAIAAEAQMRRAITLHSIGRTAEAFGLLRSVATDQRMKDELEVVNKWRYFMYWHDLIRDAIKAREADGDEIGPWDEVEVPLLPGSNPKLGMFGDDPDGVLEYPSAKDEADKEEKMEECSKGDGQSKAAPASKSSPSVRHEWYQTGQSVTLTFFAKGVDKDTAKIDIQPSSVSDFCSEYSAHPQTIIDLRVWPGFTLPIFNIVIITIILI